MGPMPPVIVVFGPEGAGKSTQSYLIADFLKEKNLKVLRLRITIRHLIMYLIYLFFLKVGRVTKLGNFVLPTLPKDRIRLFLEIFSLAVMLFVVSCLPFLGFVLIIEHYIPFIVASFVSMYGPSILNNVFIRFLLRKLSKGTLLIYLKIDYDVHLERRRDQYEHMRWINMQKHVYDVLARIYPCLELDTSKNTIIETHRLIRRAIESHLG